MENVIDLIATDSSPSEISDAIKAVIYSKAMERIDGFRPEIATSIFEVDNEVVDDEYEDEVVDEENPEDLE